MQPGRITLRTEPADTDIDPPTLTGYIGTTDQGAWVLFAHRPDEPPTLSYPRERVLRLEWGALENITADDTDAELAEQALGSANGDGEQDEPGRRFYEAFRERSPQDAPIPWENLLAVERQQWALIEGKASADRARADRLSGLRDLSISGNMETARQELKEARRICRAWDQANNVAGNRNTAPAEIEQHLTEALLALGLD